MKMPAKTNAYVVALGAVISLSLVACQPGSPVSGVRKGSSAGSSSAIANVAMPEAKQFNGVKDGLDLIDGYNLNVVSENCEESDLHKIGEYNDKSVTISLEPKCGDYSFDLKLGKHPPAGRDKLTAVYYETAAPKLLAVEDYKGKASVGIELILNLTEAGKKMGFSSGTAVSKPKDPAPSTGKPAGGGSGAADLDAKFASMTVTDSRNQSRTLASLFTKTYMLIDFSQVGCGACITRAQELVALEDPLFVKGKCNLVTIISSGLSDWIRDVGHANTSFQGSHSSIAGQFGTSVAGTPTFLLVDHSGKIVDRSAVGDASFPRQMQSLCQ